VILYRPTDAAIARETLFHEWPHLLRLNAPEALRMFHETAERVEPFTGLDPKSPNQTSSERWASIGETLFAQYASVDSLLLAKLNPVHTSIYLKAFDELVPAQSQATEVNARLSELSTKLKRFVRPKALAVLDEQIRSGGSDITVE